jgi:hypothetical protein
VCAALVVLSLGSCSGGSTSSLAPVSPASSITSPAKITADWLREQPGRQLGDFSFHLLDAEGRPLTDWRGLGIAAVEDGGGASFELTAAGRDIYLYAAYAASAMRNPGGRRRGRGIFPAVMIPRATVGWRIGAATAW